jgi:predicted RNase H-like HicB family nuclease
MIGTKPRSVNGHPDWCATPAALWNNEGMKRPFAAAVWREGCWYVSQCVEIDIASQGETEEEALANLKEALELHFEPPQATRPPKLRTIEVEVGAA